MKRIKKILQGTGLCILILLTGCVMPWDMPKDAIPNGTEEAEAEADHEEEEIVNHETHTEPLEEWPGALPDEVLENPNEPYESQEEQEETEEIVEEQGEIIEEQEPEDTAYEEPTYEEPTYEEPTIEEPTYEEPEVAEPTTTADVRGPDEAHLTARGGVFWYGDQKETWYNLDMSGVISIMTAYGWSYDDYWIREDGCKMLGPYIMVAANLDVHPRGTLVETSLGTGLVCDTGGFAQNNPLQVDIAVNW